MQMHSKENILRTIRFEGPELIPMSFHINAACWNHYKHEELIALMESHAILFPNFKRPEGTFKPRYALNAIAGKPYADPWGCIWETNEDGIIGSVHKHPLESWDAFETCQAPDPEHSNGTTPIDWNEIASSVAKSRNAGHAICLGLPHGHTFLRLQDIRGYENLIYDMSDEEPRLLRLISMIDDFNTRFTEKCIELSPDIMSFPEDLGMQKGPMLSPEQFRKYIKPSYAKCMQIARKANCAVHMHSDGDIRDLADDLIEGGVEIINLQDLVNGIDWIARRLAGKICIELDIDRQSVTRFGNPLQIDAFIREEVEKLSSPEGGLMMIYGLYPGVPLENAKAVMDAMERYCSAHRKT